VPCRLQPVLQLRHPGAPGQGQVVGDVAGGQAGLAGVAVKQVAHARCQAPFALVAAFGQCQVKSVVVLDLRARIGCLAVAPGHPVPLAVDRPVTRHAPVAAQVQLLVRGQARVLLGLTVQQALVRIIARHAQAAAGVPAAFQLKAVAALLAGVLRGAPVVGSLLATKRSTSFIWY
jgi:hypothetical protein